MRSVRTAFFALAVVSLLILPLPAQALNIQFCIPTCAGEDPDPAPTVFGPGTPVTDQSGDTTNSMSLGTFMHTRGAIAFTITATIWSQQSGTAQKIAFSPTTITVTSTSPCSTTNLCRLEVMVTSDQFDFPYPKPPGGYPAGTYIMGYFAGAAGHASAIGDAISLTAQYAGTRFVTIDYQQVLEPLGPDIINGVPGGTGTSLPASCAGHLDCRFTVTTLKKTFATQIDETVQHQCDAGVDTCVPQMQDWVNIEFVGPGDKVSF